jgi:hypothetical protein
MELTPVQRFVTFAAIVIVLAGLVVYLFLPSASGASGSPGSAAQGGSRTPGSGSRGSRAPGGGSPSPAAPAGSTGRAPDIYQWLPFTRSALASAAEVAVRFGDDYGTYSYNESTASYLAPLRSLATSQLVGLLGRAYATPGVVATRVSGKQSSAASTAILSLRAFGSTSLTFVVAITERTSIGGGGGGKGGGGTSQQVVDYAVTLTGSGTAWQASDIEPAGAGNS